MLHPPCDLRRRLPGTLRASHGWPSRRRRAPQTTRSERTGYSVSLLPAHDVRPYVRRNKTDRADAAGLLEAARCGDIHPVPVKTTDQQSVQAMHRVREHFKAQRRIGSMAKVPIWIMHRRRRLPSQPPLESLQQ